MLRHSQLHVPEKGKPTQKKRQNAGSPYLFYGLIEGISRFKGKDYKEERKGEGGGGRVVVGEHSLTWGKVTD